MRNASSKLQVSCGAFSSREEAARAYDDAARAHGILSVNFPRPGTYEVKAVRYAAFVKCAKKTGATPVAAAATAGQDNSSEEEEDEPPSPSPPPPPRKCARVVRDEEKAPQEK